MTSTEADVSISNQADTMASDADATEALLVPPVAYATPSQEDALHARGCLLTSSYSIIRPTYSYNTILQMSSLSTRPCDICHRSDVPTSFCSLCNAFLCEDCKRDYPARMRAFLAKTGRFGSR